MPTSSENHIFTKEQEILDKVDKVLNCDISDLSKEEIISDFSKLRDSYSNLLNQQIKVTKIADNIQGKLRKSQVELDENNKKINAQNEELVRLNQTKDKFFSIVSHDIRNPLTAIMLMGELMKSNFDKLSSEQLKSQTRKISDSTKLLHELFENLHRWSKSQSGILDYDPNEFNLYSVINKVLELLAVHAENKEIKLVTEVDPNIKLVGDKNMIETVIRNLVSNAIKFTNKGGTVKVCFKVNDESGKNEISVADNGIGMSQEIMDKIFKLGESSVKKKGTANEPGSGLGLILCKEFIDKHGGNIWVESEEGKGSQFLFTIPS